MIAWPDPVDEGPVDLQGVLQDGLGALWVLADEVLGSIDGPQQRLQVGCTSTRRFTAAEQVKGQGMQTGAGQHHAVGNLLEDAEGRRLPDRDGHHLLLGQRRRHGIRLHIDELDTLWIDAVEQQPGVHQVLAAGALDHAHGLAVPVFRILAGATAGGEDREVRGAADEIAEADEVVALEAVEHQDRVRSGAHVGLAGQYRLNGTMTAADFVQLHIQAFITKVTLLGGDKDR